MKMGCDVHLIAEVREGNMWEGYLINPPMGRSYIMFGTMAMVRGHFPESIAPRGFPEDASQEAINAYTLTVGRDISEEEASKLVERRVSRYITHYQVNNIDYHSASHLFLSELRDTVELADARIYEEVVEEAKESGLKKPQRETYLHTYRALIRYLEYFEERGRECRVVFWFDS
jgi:hypothetical protein